MRARVAALALTLGCAMPLAAQELLEIPPPVLVVNQDRLLQESEIGATALADIDARARALAEENARIEDDLVAEEQALTEERPTLDPEAFRAKADDFDARVQRIRAEQDQKARAITRDREAVRVRVFQDAAEAIRDIAQERGALLVLDQRDVILSADQIDITDEVIDRLGREPD